jgi:hypothetical protein
MRVRKNESVNESTISSRTLSGLFRTLKNDHPNTYVAKWSEGMIWKGDLVLRNLGFSLSPDKTEMSIYNINTKEKQNIHSVNEFVPALEKLGVSDAEISNITHYL